MMVDSPEIDVCRARSKCFSPRITPLVSTPSTRRQGIDSHESMPANSSFLLQISIRQGDTGDPIAFKVDGERFDGGTRTLKFATDTRYCVCLTVRPVIQLFSLHIGGSALQLSTNDPKSGQYSADWITSGIDVCKKGVRNKIAFTLQGPEMLLKKELQCKFYQKEDSHAEWGHKLNTLEWNCGVDESGNVSVASENFK